MINYQSEGKSHVVKIWSGWWFGDFWNLHFKYDSVGFIGLKQDPKYERLVWSTTTVDLNNTGTSHLMHLNSFYCLNVRIILKQCSLYMLYRMYRCSIQKNTQKVNETLKKQHLNKAFKQNFGLQKAGMFDPWGFVFGVKVKSHLFISKDPNKVLYNSG